MQNTRRIRSKVIGLKSGVVFDQGVAQEGDYCTYWTRLKLKRMKTSGPGPYNLKLLAMGFHKQVMTYVTHTHKNVN